MPRPRLAVLAGPTRPGLGQLVDSAAAEVCYVEDGQLPPQLAECDALLVWDFKARHLATAWTAAPRLRWIHVSSVGVDHVLLPEIVGSDVVVTNTRGLLDTAIAEFVLGCVLALAKDLPGSVRRQDQRIWEHRATRQVAGGSALIVGPGAIGTRIAMLLRAVGMTVDGAGHTARPGTGPFGRIVASAELADVVGDYDHVIVAAALTAQTRGLINADVVAAMRPSAVLVNVARGAIVDEPALVDALARGRIAGAALDVFASEPLPPESPLWGMPNVLISPHMAGDVVGWQEFRRQAFLDNFHRYASGAPLRNVVDKQLGYVKGGIS